MTSFWIGIKKNNNSRVPLAPMIDKCIGEKDICDITDIWQVHYRNLLNMVETSKSKAFVKQELKSITDSSIAFSPVDIFNALKTRRLVSHVE